MRVDRSCCVTINGLKNHLIAAVSVYAIGRINVPAGLVAGALYGAYLLCKSCPRNPLEKRPSSSSFIPVPLSEIELNSIHRPDSEGLLDKPILEDILEQANDNPELNELVSSDPTWKV